MKSLIVRDRCDVGSFVVMHREKRDGPFFAGVAAYPDYPSAEAAAKNWVKSHPGHMTYIAQIAGQLCGVVEVYEVRGE